MMVGAGRSKAVLLKFCTPSLAPSDALIARVSGAGLAARAVCDSAKQAKRSGTSRKTRANDGYLIAPLTQGIIVDLRLLYVCWFISRWDDERIEQSNTFPWVTADLRCDVGFMSLFFRFGFSLVCFAFHRGTAGNPARYNAESLDFFPAVAGLRRGRPGSL